MKKIIFSALVLIVFGISNAQTNIRFGAKGGLNFSTLTGDLSEATSRVGVSIGGFALYKITNKMAIQPEVMYSGQGASFSETTSTEFSSTRTEGGIYLGYILVPIMAKYYFSKVFNFEFGPQIGFLLEAKEKGDVVVTTDDIISAFPFDNNINDRAKSIDFGLNFGLGYDFTENSTLGIRYNLGLNNVIENQDGSDFESKNSVISFSVGYKF